jgi:hypothetical protein
VNLQEIRNNGPLNKIAHEIEKQADMSLTTEAIHIGENPGRGGEIINPGWIPFGVIICG